LLCTAIDAAHAAPPAESVSVQHPSFSCAKPTALEMVICADPVLADDDRRMAVLYAAARAGALGDGGSQVEHTQRVWLKSRNAACANGDARGYVSRMLLNPRDHRDHMNSESMDSPQESSEAQVASASSQTAEAVKLAQEHLTALTKLLEEAKVAAAAAIENQRLTTVALTESQSRLAETNTVATAIAAAGAKINSEVAVIDGQSAHISEAQTHADTVRAALDRASTQATQSATTAEGLRARAQTAADDAAALLVEVQANKASTDVGATAVIRVRL